MIPRRWAFTLPNEFTRLRQWCDSEAALDDGLVRAWEAAVAGYVGMPHAAAVNSGRYGMTLIFEHLGVGEGDEVIVPAYTLKDLVPLVQALGARAVAADVDPGTLNVTRESVAARLTARTRAILALHAFGNPAPVREVAALADERGVAVIEDCAHSLGAALDGVQTGSFGYAGFYSFEPTKPINTYGGGMVVSRDEGLIARIRESTREKPLDLDTLKTKAATVKKEQFMMGTGLAWPILAAMANPVVKELIARRYRSAQSVPSSAFRYAPPQAKLGLEKLEGLAERLEARRACAALLREALHDSIAVQKVADNAQSTWYFFIALLPGGAARARARLILRGVDAAVEEEIADDVGSMLGQEDCLNAAEAYRRAIALPLFDGMTERQVRRVARAVNRIATQSEQAGPG